MIFIYPFCHLLRKIDWVKSPIIAQYIDTTVRFYRNKSVRIILSLARQSVLTHWTRTFLSLSVPSKRVVIVPSEQEPSPARPVFIWVITNYDAGDRIYQKIAPGDTSAD